MDFIECLPKSHGKSVIFVMVDKLSKYTHFMAMKHPFTSSDMARVFLVNVHKLHGLPKVTIDGQSKVVNKCLGCYLRCMSRLKPKECVDWLPLAKFWYNINCHSGTKASLFEIVYGQPPPIHLPYVHVGSVVEVVDRSLWAREHAIQILQFYLKRAQDRMINMANKLRTERVFVVGEWVYVKLKPHRHVSI
ncbi:ty3-gypsy retrotransposon protein [Tanacetum coccineum]